jgi:hypothetical protein
MAFESKNVNVEELIKAKEQQLTSRDYLDFSEEEFASMTEQEASKIESHFHGHAMMMLPETEIAFFVWLKKNDPPVWDDLWKDVEKPYHVSIDFLHHFLKNNNGFPICDLVNEDNYWFTAPHLKPKGIQKIEEISDKISNNESLSFEEAFLTEIVRGSIDLWHFCYQYKVPVKVAKEKVDAMHRDDILVHLSDREDLIKYLDI